MGCSDINVENFCQTFGFAGYFKCSAKKFNQLQTDNPTGSSARNKSPCRKNPVESSSTSKSPCREFSYISSHPVERMGMDTAVKTMVKKVFITSCSNHTVHGTVFCRCWNKVLRCQRLVLFLQKTLLLVTSIILQAHRLKDAVHEHF